MMRTTLLTIDVLRWGGGEGGGGKSLHVNIPQSNLHKRYHYYSGFSQTKLVLKSTSSYNLS